MASIAIPIIAALEPGAEELIVKLIDKIFPHGSGPTKFDVGMSWFQSLFGGLVKALPGTPTPPDQATLSGWLQNLVNKLNAQGVLKGPDTVVVAANGLTLDSGIQLLTWLKTAPLPIPGGKP